ncbi:A/G-specific adenine glycosylase [Methanocalculus sp.]|uniref:A/G-specific adenine glycosylase n=1 Tax=Methanocalculus sp. TaxID=2004547 RepID=UPI002717C78B|nr:A/G-specific adenine glycosylase [Methanocalculus sp.]MDO8842576.1 A/G-specific adenine glycosylase [Methanocalculus sp.]
MNCTPDQNQREEALLKAAKTGPTQEAITLFQDLVLSYYHEHGRDLPWRDTTNPYKILVSEIMLQQTQVERVIPKYKAFLATFETIDQLAAAPLSEVLTAWSGLGYNRRAINLQRTAGIIRNEHNGYLPKNPDTLATFPGIGKATAAAICAYAFNMPVVYIETNIRRVFIHFFFQDQVNIPDTDILPVIEAALDRENPGVWYSALMDYGTLLKLRLKNPNQRSRHYTRQAPFAGSDREIRGKILRLLIERTKMERRSLIRSLDTDEVRVEKVLQDLWKEGFVQEDAGLYSIKK